MKILEWMQKRINGGSNEKKKPSHHQISTTYHMRHEPCKQEFNDWPQTLLAIGTFGNENSNKQKDDSEKSKASRALDPLCFQDFVNEFTLEEVGSLQDELNKYFRLPEEPNSTVKPLDTEGSSLEEENETFSDDVSNSNHDDGGDVYQQRSSLMNAKGKNQCLDHNSSKINGVAKKSVKFLLKKMFICNSGFQPTTPFLKDPSSLSTESRMEKILRAILNKKIYPHQGSSSSKMFIKKYLETKSMPQYYSDDDEEEEFDKAVVNGCKWVKTDADYIVLEI